LQQSFAFNLDTWGCTVGHAFYQRRLVELLMELRHEVVESMRRMPHEMRGPGPARVEWSRTPEGHVVVRFGGIPRKIVGERLAWIFAEVAEAKGRELSWSELLTRRMHYQVKEHGAQEAENVAESSMERYGREIRNQLDPFGDFWESDAKGARWRGDEPMSP
jgi:hypothetical protein